MTHYSIFIFIGYWFRNHLPPPATNPLVNSIVALIILCNDCQHHAGSLMMWFLFLCTGDYGELGSKVERNSLWETFQIAQQTSFTLLLTFPTRTQSQSKWPAKENQTVGTNDQGWIEVHHTGDARGGRQGFKDDFYAAEKAGQLSVVQHGWVSGKLYCLGI